MQTKWLPAREKQWWSISVCRREREEKSNGDDDDDGGSEREREKRLYLYYRHRASSKKSFLVGAAMFWSGKAALPTPSFFLSLADEKSRQKERRNDIAVDLARRARARVFLLMFTESFASLASTQFGTFLGFDSFFPPTTRARAHAQHFEPLLD